MPHDDRTLGDLAATLGSELVSRGWRLVTAESCTGGWIAKVLTDIPGSSAWFDSAAVTYSNDAKVRDLGVDSAVLEEHGAVSQPVVEAMAAGIRSRSGCEVAAAVSGIAGPDGGTPGKPVGLVWFAWSAGEERRSEARVFDGDREAVRRATVAHALAGLMQLIRAASP